MNNGWIKLHRKFIEWEWFNKPEMVSLFLHLLLSANHKEKKWQGTTVKPGQLITGRKSLAKKTGISEQTIRTCLAKLKSTNEITIKTTNKFTIITINNWSVHQNQPAKQPTTNQQLTTNNNDKNEKNKSFFIFKDGTKGFLDKKKQVWKECDTYQLLGDIYLKELNGKN